MRRLLGALCVLIVATSLQGCLRVNWQRRTGYVEVEQEVLDSIPEEGGTLEDILALMGAPTHIWRYKRLSMAMAYAWIGDRGVAFTASAPLQGTRGALWYTYGDARTRLRAVVFFFDDRFNLTHWNLGYLSDLAPAEALLPDPRRQ